jgi:hypothetical protein
MSKKILLYGMRGGVFCIPAASSKPSRFLLRIRLDSLCAFSRKEGSFKTRITPSYSGPSVTSNMRETTTPAPWCAAFHALSGWSAMTGRPTIGTPCHSPCSPRTALEPCVLLFQRLSSIIWLDRGSDLPRHWEVKTTRDTHTHSLTQPNICGAFHAGVGLLSQCREAHNGHAVPQPLPPLHSRCE